jgi:hypothetical protein
MLSFTAVRGVLGMEQSTLKLSVSILGRQPCTSELLCIDLYFGLTYTVTQEDEDD